MTAPQQFLSSPTSDPEWRKHAACLGRDTLFFDDVEEPAAERQHRTALAKAICGDCPVLIECRESALRLGEPYGIWGGLSERDRARLLGVRTLRYAGVNRQRHMDQGIHSSTSHNQEQQTHDEFRGPRVDDADRGLPIG